MPYVGRTVQFGPAGAGSTETSGTCVMLPHVAFINDDMDVCRMQPLLIID